MTLRSVCTLALTLIFSMSAFAAPPTDGLPIAARVGWLRSPDLQKRRLAAEWLTQLGVPAEALPDLARNLAVTKDPYLRKVSADALVSAGASAVFVVRAELKEPASRDLAAEVLGRIGKPAKAAADDLKPYLKDESPAVRLAVASALWDVAGDPAGAGVLGELIGDKNREIGYNAAVALERFGKEAAPALDALRAGLKLPSLTTNIPPQCASVIGRLGDAAKPAVPDLLAVLEMKHPDKNLAYLLIPVHTEATLALGRLKAEVPTVLPRLVDLLEFRSTLAFVGKTTRLDPTQVYQNELDTILIGLGEPAQAAVVAQLRHREPGKRAGAARCLRGMGVLPEDVRKELRRVAEEDASLEAVRWAILALVGDGPLSANDVPLLIDALAEPARVHHGGHMPSTHFDWRGAVMPVLIRTGADAVPALTAALGESSLPDLRAGAAETLAKMGKVAEPARKALRVLARRIVKGGLPLDDVWAAIALLELGETDSELYEILADAREGGPYGMYDLLPWKVVTDAARATLKRSGVRAVPALLRTDEPTAVLVDMARTDAGVREALVTALTKGEGRTPLAAAAVLGEVGAPLSKALIELVEGQSPLSVAAAEVVSRVEPTNERVLTVLTRAMSDRDAGIRATACRGLGRVRTEMMAVYLRKLLVEAEWDQSTALRAAFYQSAEQPLPLLADALNDPATVERAANELGQYGGDAIPHLVRGLAGTPKMRATILNTLGSLGRSASETLPQVTQYLKAEEPAVRAAAALAVIRLGGDASDARPLLRADLKNGKPGVRRAAAHALGFFPPSADDGLLEAFAKDADAGVRQACIAPLRRERQSEPVKTALLKALHEDKLSAVRAACVQALQSMELTPAEQGRLYAAFADPADEVRVALTDCLDGYEDIKNVPGLVAILRKATSDKLPNVRQSAVQALVDLQATEALPELLAGFEKKDTESAARMALRRFKVPAIPALVKAMESDPLTPKARVELARALMWHHDKAKAAVPTLQKWLGDGDLRVRQMAAEALGQIGASSADAVPALVKATDDADRSVQIAAVTALGRIGQTSPEVVDVLLRHLQDETGLGEAAAQSLVQFAPPGDKVRAALVAALAGPHREKTAFGLAKLGEVGQTALYEALQQGGSPQAAALDALGNATVPVEKVLPTLVKLLSAEDVPTRLAVLRVLDSHPAEAKAAVKELTARVADESESVRSAAAHALIHAGKSAEETVRKLRRDPSASVRRTAYQTLATVAADKVRP